MARVDQAIITRYFAIRPRRSLTVLLKALVNPPSITYVEDNMPLGGSGGIDMRGSSRRKPYEEDFAETNRQRWRNNILGLLILALMVCLALDVGGCAHWLGNALAK